ncbi:MAG TPA: GTP-binding protein, partial [Stellaceae bacterium]|nr:GTP-binding protein [Stellaceae bacterium]
MTQATRLPVILVTGFLGSGKTTMLRHLLRSPKAADTAIIVNEIGAVGLDHHLLWTSTETTVVLENGCVCCSLREDLAETLSSLFWQRLRREIPRFERIVVETTGLADPRHVVATFATDPLLVERFRLQSVITTVDAALGMERHERHDEWAAQIGMADTLLLTKTDLASADQVAATTKLLGELNPLARVTPMARGDVAPEIIWQAGRTRPPGRVPFTLKPH